MRHRITCADLAATLERAHSDSVLDADDCAAIFYDLSFLSERAADLRAQFPQSALHAIAVKANPLVATLSLLCRAGVGAEAASLPEVRLAETAGYSPDKIVFDSPAKTRQELIYSLERGIRINADSLDELELIDGLLAGKRPKGPIGVRINPQIGEGKDKLSSTAGEYSKFGVPIKQFRQQLLERFRKHEWLEGIHLHIGSQTIEILQLVAGIKIGLEFADEIDRARKAAGLKPLAVFDLGGGLPVTYRQDDPKPSMADYRRVLGNECPELFSGRFQLVTEFGRYMHSPAGWAASRVESVKREFKVFDQTFNTATVHLGADMFLRKCYNPEKWHHDIVVLDGEGRLKNGTDKSPYKVVGPLCFSGDIIADGVCLPRIEPGDWIAVRDTGAYTLSMWSRYNSRQIPKVIGYENNGERFTILRPRESAEDLIRFWSPDNGN